MHTRASNRIFLFVLVSIIAEATFVLLFAYNFFHALVRDIAIVFPSNQYVMNFYVSTNRTLAPIIVKFNFAIGIWTIVNSALGLGAAVIRYTD